MLKEIERSTALELKLESFEPGEVGEPVEITTDLGTVTATWLGVVGDGAGAISLTEAMRLMCEISDERKAARRDNGKNRS